MALVSSSYGQGQVNFQNYNFGATTLNAPVTFGKTQNSGGVNGVLGTRIGKEFNAALEFSLDGTTFNTLTAAQANDGTAYPTPFAFGIGNDGDAANFAGYFFGNSVQIPGYTSGSISFKIDVYNGTSFSSGNTTWNGQSATFTMPSITVVGGTALPSDFAGLNSFTVNPVPEPTVFALAGIGAAALMIVRRKK